jgi:hypothetical protein
MTAMMSMVMSAMVMSATVVSATVMSATAAVAWTAADLDQRVACCAPLTLFRAAEIARLRERGSGGKSKRKGADKTKFAKTAFHEMHSMQDKPVMEAVRSENTR